MSHDSNTTTDEQQTVPSTPLKAYGQGIDFLLWKQRIQHQKPQMPLNDRSLTMHKVVAKTGASRTSVNRWIKAGLFPKGRKYSHNMRRWLESEVDTWILSREG